MPGKREEQCEARGRRKHKGEKRTVKVGGVVHAGDSVAAALIQVAETKREINELEEEKERREEEEEKPRNLTALER